MPSDYVGAGAEIRKQLRDDKDDSTLPILSLGGDGRDLAQGRGLSHLVQVVCHL